MPKSNYIIRFGGLPVGIHEFEFEITDTFFSQIETSEIRRADVKARVVLTKQNNVLQAEFRMAGTLGVDCDRCLKEFGYPVETQDSLVIKHGNPDETTDEILVIPEGQEHFDATQFIYESLVLALPARRVPCEVDPEAFVCDYEVLSKLNEIATDEEASEEAPGNPIWEQLNKIKYNKN